MALTVSQAAAHLRALLEADVILSDVWIAGEVSNFKRASSGHCYLSLKDDAASLDGVIWRTHAARLPGPLQSGDAVLAHGYVSLYEPGGRLQLYIDAVQPAGVGILYAQFEALKASLDAEGLFASQRPLPPLPRRIGIVTSPTGAALQDMLNVLARRFPLALVLLAPCLVQGAQAPDSISAALHRLYALPPAQQPDVLIVARGGGSLEDLWAFNSETVARALAASPVPTISGVGHETDTTIADFVADLRAPTPSAAAELAAPDIDALHATLADLRARLEAPLMQQLASHQQQLTDLHTALQRQHPLARLNRARQEIDDLTRRASLTLRHMLALHRGQLATVHAQLATLSPQATLARGYALVRRSADDHLVTHAAQVAPGDQLTLRLQDGTLTVHVHAAHPESPPPYQESPRTEPA